MGNFPNDFDRNGNTWAGWDQVEAGIGTRVPRWKAVIQSTCEAGSGMDGLSLASGSKVTGYETARKPAA